MHGGKRILARRFLPALLLLGCGEAARSTASDEPPGPVEIRVIDELGQAVPNTALLVDGALVTTDERGRALTAPAPARYDVVLVVDGAVYAFAGLTTRAAVLRLRQSTAPAQTSYATVELEAPDGLGTDQRLFFWAGVDGLPADAQANDFGDDDTARYVRTTWHGSAGVVLSTQAVVAELDPEQLGVIGYSAYAATSFELLPDDYALWRPAFAPVPFDTVPIHVETDADPRGVSFDAIVSGAAGLLGEAAFVSGVAAADLPVLDLPGARYYVRASGEQMGGRFIAEARDVEAGASIFLHAAPAPQVLTPDSGATIDLGTDFGWTPAEGAIYRLHVYADDGAEPFFQYDIATSEPTARLPDVAPLGFAFPVGRTIAWEVHSELGHASLASYAAGEPSHGQGDANTRLAIGASP